MVLLCWSFQSCQIILNYVLCGLFYHPPSSPVSALDNFCVVLERLDPSYFCNLVLLGDFKLAL